MKRQNAGMTLVELVVSTGLAAIVMTAVFKLVDVTLDLWAKGEARRTVVEQASATAELMAKDFRALHPGNQGDLLVDWWPFDVDGDGRIDCTWPRIRMVRQAARADLTRIAAETLDPAAVAEARRLGTTVEELLPEGVTLPETPETGLIAIGYCVLPAGQDPDVRGEGILMRGEELFVPGQPPAMFESNFFSAAGQPRGGAMREVTGGVLWMGLQFATQTSIVWDDWEVGSELADTSASWDAWNEGRPNADNSLWNEPGAGMPAVEGEALLPRRVRIELEFEGRRERKRRTRLSDSIEKSGSQLLVENGERVPRKAGSFILVDGEWMEVRSVHGDRVNVRRGVRGTEATSHKSGVLIQWGESVVIEVPVPTYRDDWNLGAGR